MLHFIIIYVGINIAVSVARGGVVLWDYEDGEGTIRPFLPWEIPKHCNKLTKLGVILSVTLHTLLAPSTVVIEGIVWAIRKLIKKLIKVCVKEDYRK